MTIKKTFEAGGVEYTIKIYGREKWIWDYILVSLESNVREGHCRVIGEYLFYAKNEYINPEDRRVRKSKQKREITWVMYESEAEKRKARALWRQAGSGSEEEKNLLSQHEEIINDFEKNV